MPSCRHPLGHFVRAETLATRKKQLRPQNGGGPGYLNTTFSVPEQDLGRKDNWWFSRAKPQNVVDKSV
jgi:hypothetical protein